MAVFATQGRGQSHPIVGVDLNVGPATRQGDMGEPAIDKGFGGLVRLHVHEDPFGGLPLAIVACYGVAVIKMHGLVAVEGDGSAGIEAYLEGLRVRFNRRDDAEFTVGEMAASVGRSELHAVADGQVPLDLAVDRHAVEAPRIVIDCLAMAWDLRVSSRDGSGPSGHLSSGWRC